MQLPLTMSDLSKQKKFGISSHKGHRNKKGFSTLFTCGLFVLIIVGVGFLLTRKVEFVSPNKPANVDSFGTVQSASGAAALSKGGNSLSKFKSIQSPLREAKIVGLYFAASWCGMSDPVSENLDNIFMAGSMQNRILSKDRTADASVRQTDFAIVHVSSDFSEDKMSNYTRSNWIDVPFNSPDKNNLKRHFRTCAEIEMADLGIDVRRFIIPTLIIIDSQTQGILSTNGVDELKEYGEGVLDHWLQLQALTRGLEDKYDEQ